jgi:hypothetical protein
MATLNDIPPSIELKLTLILDEEEASALHDIVSYGTDNFLKVFYAHLGQAYLSKHEAGLRRLFERIRTDLPPIIARYDKARELFSSSQREAS